MNTFHLGRTDAPFYVCRLRAAGGKGGVASAGY